MSKARIKLQLSGARDKPHKYRKIVTVAVYSIIGTISGVFFGAAFDKAIFPMILGIVFGGFSQYNSWAGRILNSICASLTACSSADYHWTPPRERVGSVICPDRSNCRWRYNSIHSPHGQYVLGRFSQTCL